MTLDDILNDNALVQEFTAWAPGLQSYVLFCQAQSMGFDPNQIMAQYGPDGVTPIDWAALGQTVNESPDPAAFKAAVREFSNKEIDFS